MRAPLALSIAVVISLIAGAVVGYALTPGSITSMSRRSMTKRGLVPSSGPRVVGGPVAVAPVTPLVVTSPYGRRGFKFHAGVDLRAPTGTTLRAVGPGTVLRTGRNGVGGLTVVVDLDDGWRAGYAHLSRVDVEAGQRVDAGTRIGLAGATGRASGPHLHFELREPMSMALVDPWPHLNGKAPSYVTKASVKNTHVANAEHAKHAKNAKATHVNATTTKAKAKATLKMIKRAVRRWV